MIRPTARNWDRMLDLPRSSGSHAPVIAVGQLLVANVAISARAVEDPLNLAVGEAPPAAHLKRRPTGPHTWRATGRKEFIGAQPPA